MFIDTCCPRKYYVNTNQWFSKQFCLCSNIIIVYFHCSSSLSTKVLTPVGHRLDEWKKQLSNLDKDHDKGQLKVPFKVPIDI